MYFRVAPVQSATPIAPAALPTMKIDLNPVQKRATSPVVTKSHHHTEEKIENPEIITTISQNNNDSDDDAPIIPWRAQLRKTNSKLNILD